MSRIRAYAAGGPGQRLEPFEYDPGPLNPFEVEISVSHCGVCYTDLSLIDDHFFGMSSYPLVPGHEVVGRICAMGEGVEQLEVGQRVGAGFLCGACLSCSSCRRGVPQLCPAARGICVQGRHGGFAQRVRVDGRFAMPIPSGLESDQAAPLMCAGITVFAPLDELGAKATKRVGVVGIGGLGHLALQFAKALGCEVTAFSRTSDKADDARRFGADHVVATCEAGALESLAGSFDLVLSTVEGDLPWNSYLNLLRPMGTLSLVGFPQKPLTLDGNLLIWGRRSIQGSTVGNPAQVERMLELAARCGVRAQTEVFPLREINSAIDRVRGGAARYRVVVSTDDS
jgi:uncharacterized zinc-type alcohol dehydrogenase-like protein